MRWVLLALWCCACSSPTAPIATAPVATAPQPKDRVPASDAWPEQPLFNGKRLRLPSIATLVPHREGTPTDQTQVRFASGYVLRLTAGHYDIAGEISTYRRSGDTRETLVEARDAVVVVRQEAPDRHAIGRYCEVTVCAQGICAYAEGALVGGGKVTKMTDDECLATVAIVRSIHGATP